MFRWNERLHHKNPRGSAYINTYILNTIQRHDRGFIGSSLPLELSGVHPMIERPITEFFFSFLSQNPDQKLRADTDILTAHRAANRSFNINEVDWGPTIIKLPGRVFRGRPGSALQPGREGIVMRSKRTARGRRVSK